MDNNLDAFWGPGEAGIPDVELSLMALDSNGQYTDTGLRTRTNASGHYEFQRSLGLPPGEYRITQIQADGLFSVAAVPGSVNGQATGSSFGVRVYEARIYVVL